MLSGLHEPPVFRDRESICPLCGRMRTSIIEEDGGYRVNSPCRQFERVVSLIEEVSCLKRLTTPIATLPAKINFVIA